MTRSTARRNGRSINRRDADSPDIATYAYLSDGSPVLSTRVRTQSGEAVVTECFAMREGGREHPYRQLLRVVDGVRGSVDFRIDIAPRFDYGDVKPWLRHHAPGVSSAIGGNDALVVECDTDLEIADDHELRTVWSVLGNFPRALTHLSQITAAVALTRATQTPRLRR